MNRLLLAATVLIGCSPTHPVKAERWPTFELVEAAREGESHGGFPPGFFVTLAGTPMPFRGADYETPAARAAEDGWSVLPAFGQGQPAAYVVTELWQDHPDPWIQPVYVLVSRFDPITRQTVDGVRVPVVFGVGEESTFYSPYWQAVLVKTNEPAPATGLGDTREVLAAATQTLVGARPLCPITPTGFTIARTAGDPVHPFTKVALTPQTAAPVRIDGATASYIDFGPDRFVVTASGLVRPTRIFFFTRMVNGERTLLELPAVLANNAVRSGYARRFDVLLDQEPVFVPAGPQWDVVRAKLGAPAADPAIPTEVANAYALRVAKTSACFATASKFPSGCEWLDGEGAIDRLEPRSVIRTEVTMTAVPLLFAGERL